MIVQKPIYRKDLEDIDKASCFAIIIFCPIIDVMKTSILKGLSLISLVKTSLLLHYNRRGRLILAITTYKLQIFNNSFLNDLTQSINHEAIN